ncbi:C40 family peptidase [Reichenbachiella versicolor]|uniref:C40 family peptidase n=1 Tax=Reichenbachiella versicolor TaxID=1821036 RepID=UPI000D6E46B0|nr:C40 family peptidase [Reichenbachiella versicolor]
MKKVILILLALSCIGLSNTYAQKKKKKRRAAETTKVVTTAKAYIGTPYRYGGTTRKGIDCSALIQNSFSKAGYKVPRTSKEQSKYGKNVGWKKVKEGDLVFFKFKKKGKKWNHSGLITKVDGKNIRFIHASSSKGVVESNLMVDYYKDNVIGFRRVIQ